MIQYHSANIGAERQSAYVLLALRTVQPQMRYLREKLQRFGSAVEFLLNILRESIVMEQRAGCEVLQRVSVNAHFFRGTYAHICHTLCMAACNMDKLRFHAVERVGAGSQKPKNIKFHTNPS